VDVCLKSDDPGILFLRYVQAKHDIISGTCPCNLAILDKLAATSLRKRYGVFNKILHGNRFISDMLLELVPKSEICRKKISRWQTDILKCFKDISAKSFDPLVEYLRLVETLDLYGSVCYQAKCNNIDVVLAVNCKGILKCENNSLRVLEMIMWEEMCSWGVHSNSHQQVFFIKRSHSPMLAIPHDELEQLDFVLHQPKVLCRFVTALAQLIVRNLQIENAEQKAFQAAALLQACARGILTRNKLDQEFWVVRIQALWRAFKVRNVDRCTEEKVAIKLQSLFRAFAARKQLYSVQEVLSAVYIQAMLRGFLVRIKPPKQNSTNGFLVSKQQRFNIETTNQHNPRWNSKQFEQISKQQRSFSETINQNSPRSNVRQYRHSLPPAIPPPPSIPPPGFDDDFYSPPPPDSPPPRNLKTFILPQAPPSPAFSEFDESDDYSV